MSILEQELIDIHIDECIQTIDYEAEYDNQPVNVFLSFVPFKDGAIDILSLLYLIKEHIIVKFAITYKDAQRQYKRWDKLEADKYLYEKAIRKITENTAKGKLGELLLFTFLEKYLGAPKILSKISALQDNEDHAKGADAIHAQFVDGELVLYLGEAKLWSQYSGACSDAVGSMIETHESYQEEFDLLENYIDFPNISEDFKDSILDILNPYYNLSHTHLFHMPCFIGFESNICKRINSAEEYEEKYRNAAQRRINTFFDKVETPLDVENVTLILLPFESIDDFTEQFIEVLGISS